MFAADGVVFAGHGVAHFARRRKEEGLPVAEGSHARARRVEPCACKLFTSSDFVEGTVITLGNTISDHKK